MHNTTYKHQLLVEGIVVVVGAVATFFACTYFIG